MRDAHEIRMLLTRVIAQIGRTKARGLHIGDLEYALGVVDALNFAVGDSDGADAILESVRNSVAYLNTSRPLLPTRNPTDTTEE